MFDYFSNETLFYGGLIVASVVGVVLLVLLFIIHLRIRGLKKQFDKEYGKEI